MNMHDTVELLNSQPGVTVLGCATSHDILFSCDDQTTLTQLANIAKLAGWSILIFPYVGKVVYHLHGADLNKFAKALSSPGSQKASDLGIPDLSLVTVRQMAEELKARTNLTFALTWIEAGDQDNITLEGCGHPTKVVGLLARATNLAIKFADRDFTYQEPDDSNP